MAAENVTARFASGQLAQSVSAILVLALGVRTALSVDRLDELSMAAGIVLARCGGDVTVSLEAGAEWLSVTIEPADTAWVEGNRLLLAPLIDSMEVHGNGVALRAG